MVLCSCSAVAILSFTSGTLPRPPLAGPWVYHHSAVRDAEFTAALVTLDGAIGSGDFAAGSIRGPPTRDVISFSPDGKTLLTGGADGKTPGSGPPMEWGEWPHRRIAGHVRDIGVIHFPRMAPEPSLPGTVKRRPFGTPRTGTSRVAFRDFAAALSPRPSAPNSQWILTGMADVPPSFGRCRMVSPSADGWKFVSRHRCGDPGRRPGDSVRPRERHGATLEYGNWRADGRTNMHGAIEFVGFAPDVGWQPLPAMTTTFGDGLDTGRQIGCACAVRSASRSQPEANGSFRAALPR